MHWYQLDPEIVLKRLHTSLNGLPFDEVHKRNILYPPNTIRVAREPSFIRIFLLQFKSFLSLLLIALGLLALATSHFLVTQENILDAIIIFLLLLLNALLGTYQDYKSSKAARKTQLFTQTTAIVRRGGIEQNIPAKELVPGDIIVLREGMRVPADARIISAIHLDTDEATLTGESHAHTKSPLTIPTEVPLVHQLNMVFMDTHVVHGKAEAVVVRTGKDTVVGKIAQKLKENYKSPFTHELDRATNKMSAIALFLIGLVVLIFLARKMPITDILFLASALLIGAIPQALPAIVTYAISASETYLQKKKILIKRKTLLETLGSVDVICTDKTGTLTCNKLQIQKINLANHTSFEKMPKALQDLFQKIALLPNEAEHTEKGFVGDAIDIAFIDYFNEHNLDILSFKDKYKYKSFSPFSPESKIAYSSHKIDKKIMTFYKGEPHETIKLCKYIQIKNKILPLTAKRKKAIHDTLLTFSKEALKNVGLAYKSGSKIIFFGIVGLYDPPKADIADAIKSAYAAGIDVKMVTGDNKETALSLAKICGFRKPKVLDWLDLRDLSQEQFSKAVETHNIFSRMDPTNKLKIVKTLEDNGHRVAITGDGVNDGPALSEATVGIAMGKHSEDVAKDAADLIVLNDEFNSIIEGIKQGRTIFFNVKKVVKYLLTANLGEILMIVIGALFGIIPILPVQLLWVNFITSYAPAVAFGANPPPKNIMNQKPTGKKEQLITKSITKSAIYLAIKKVIILSILFYGSYTFTKDLALSQSILFTWIIMWHFVRVMFMRLKQGMGILEKKSVLLALAIPAILQILIIYSPLNIFFRTVPLGFASWLLILLFIVIAIYSEEIMDKIIEHRHDKSKDKSVPG